MTIFKLIRSDSLAFRARVTEPTEPRKTAFLDGIYTRPPSISGS